MVKATFPALYGATHPKSLLAPTTPSPFIVPIIPSRNVNRPLINY